MPLASVPSEEPEQLIIGKFEGLVVNRARLAVGSVGEFPCLDDQGDVLKLAEGDIAVVQVEVLVTAIQHGASYKGGMVIGPRDRTHLGKVIEGSPQIVGVARRA
jgi:hypothetical protein